MENENLGYKLEILTRVGVKFTWCTWGYYTCKEEAKNTALNMIENNERNVKAYTIKTIRGDK